ncbi:N-acetyltransferase [Alphaproteobacteria bacterium KMM 3653]|uniref:N-acetyltransferase n=1 Tax=Harenicola maris TaxID=2841044 RepID=A0AAP2G2J5_9RHOB|nr:N-acetyltransferase [Harenicola maris]
MYKLHPETTDDAYEVEALYDLVFAPGREALSSYRLREGVPAEAGLSRVARDEGGILAGALRFWPVSVGGAEALLLGPIAVHPTRQGEGLGGLLMAEGLAAAWAAGWPRVMLVGDYAYYRRFGFEHLSGVVMPPPTNPERVLGQGDWAGITGPVERRLP